MQVFLFEVPKLFLIKLIVVIRPFRFTAIFEIADIFFGNASKDWKQREFPKY